METAVEELPASYTVGSIIYLTEPLRRALVTETKAWKQAFGKALANKVIKRNCFCGSIPRFTSWHSNSLYLHTPYFTSVHLTSTQHSPLYLNTPQIIPRQHISPHFTSSHFTSTHFPLLSFNILYHIVRHLNSPLHTSPHFTSTHFSSNTLPYLSQHTLPNFSSTHLTLPQHTFVVTLPWNTSHRYSSALILPHLTFLSYIVLRTFPSLWHLNLLFTLARKLS